MAKDPVRDTYEMTVPEDRFDGDAVRGLRFGVVLRGYAMDQVDAVLDRVAGDLEARDTRIAELEAQLPEAPKRSADALVRTAIARLPQNQQEVIHLHWFEDVPFDKVGERIGVSYTAVRTRAARGYARLRSLLSGDPVDDSSATS